MARMKRLVLAGLVLLATAGLARAQDAAVEALRKSFPTQEQILLAGVLADPANARAFAQDAHAGVTAAAQQKWRAQIAQFSRDYLDHPHVTNEKGRTVQEMGEPAEWAILMTSLKILADGSLIDKAKFKIFLGRLDDANDDLKAGDNKSAIKFIAEARQILSKAARDYLDTPAGQSALADARRRRQEAKDKADAQARADAEAKQKSEAEARARQQQTAAAAPASKPAAQKPAARPPASRPSAGPSAPQTSGSALDQAKQADKAARAGGSDERNSSELNGSYDGAGSRGDPPPVSAGVTPDAGSELPPGGRLMPSKGAGTTVPTLTVQPPAPDADPDLAQLHAMKKKVSGVKKWLTMGGGGLLGGLLGFLLGGPIGAVVGAVVGAGGGFFLGKTLFG